jgi:DNA-binding Lrp family transcriptional regulator
MSDDSKPRSKNGQWQPTASEQEVITAIEKHSPAATSEIAEEIGMTRQGADARLRRLHEAGVVDKKKIGASLVWFIDTDTNTRDDTDTDARKDEAGDDESSVSMPTVEDGLNPNAVTKDYIGDGDE